MTVAGLRRPNPAHVSKNLKSSFSLTVLKLGAFFVFERLWGQGGGFAQFVHWHVMLKVGVESWLHLAEGPLYFSL